MPPLPDLESASSTIASLIGPPFAWCAVSGGPVRLEDATAYGGSTGGNFTVSDFWIARYQVTNAQFQAFIDAPGGFADPCWWDFSPQARQWRSDRQNPMQAAFSGGNLPRTRSSWFDVVAFTRWLDAQWLRLDPEMAARWRVRLPTETEWQRAAHGDTGWAYPWGETLDPTRANYASMIGSPTPVGQYPQGGSPFGALDMTGNLWEWCLTTWGTDKDDDLSGYIYRAMRGGAWNNVRADDLRAAARYGHPPRGRLNDAGFRVACAARGLGLPEHEST